MENIVALIVDDEPIARDIVRTYLAAHGNITIAGECDNGIAAVNAIRQLRPQLLFIDIQMPGLNGFEVLGKFQPQELPLVIFTTAYDRFALEAFEINATDYLLKPFTKERFNHALNKALQLLNNKNNSYDRLSQLLETYHKLTLPANKYLKQITVKDSKRIFFIKTEDIYCIEASGNYVMVYTSNHSHMVYTTLNELEETLHPGYFCRVHRSSIVNVTYIKELTPHFNNEYFIVLLNNKQIKLSRTYRPRLQELLNSKF